MLKIFLAIAITIQLLLGAIETHRKNYTEGNTNFILAFLFLNKLKEENKE